MPTAKFQLVCAVYPHEEGAELELEVGEDGLPVAQVFKARARKIEVASPKGSKAPPGNQAARK